MLVLLSMLAPPSLLLPVARPPSLLLPTSAAHMPVRCAPSRARWPSLRESSSSEPGGGGALALGGTQLEQALGALPDDEKYNAVLLSLLSKRGAEGGIDKTVELVREMSAKRLKVNPPARKALLDAVVDVGAVEGILSTLRAVRDNGACRSFGTPEVRLPARPRAGALSTLAEVPTDARAEEVSIASAVSLGVGGLLLLEVLDFIDFILPGVDVSAPPPGLLIAGLAAFWAFDRYTQQSSTFALLSRGLARLFQRDLQRECAVESASFLLGYLLGLPCCPFTPTAFKPLDMLGKVGTSMEEAVGADLPPRLVDRTLIWLMAPTALEASEYRELMQAEPTLGAQFLSAARRREAATGVDVTQGGWADDEDDARLRWAYSEARRLLQRYSGVRTELQEVMAAGVSAGDCVNLIEDRLKRNWAAI